MKHFQAVIFDLDDTLYPERSYAHSGFAAVADAFGHVLGDADAAVEEMKRLFETEARPRVFDTLLAERHLQVDPAALADMIETYRTHHPSITLYPDADAVLNRLAGPCKLGLITDGRSVAQWAKIDALGLRDRLDKIIVTSQLGPGAQKPSRIPFERMADALGVAHNGCVYVADNPAKDFVAPNALGWTSVLVRRDDGIYRDNKPANDGRPVHDIQSLDELNRILNR